MVRCFVFVIICVFPIVVAAGGASDLFVDFDGDGINDNTVDLDNNKIPDQFQKTVHLAVPSASTSLPYYFSQAALESGEAVILSKANKFLLKKYVCRLLTTCRSSFDADFSPGEKNTSANGSTCAGGICF